MIATQLNSTTHGRTKQNFCYGRSTKFCAPPPKFSLKPFNFSLYCSIPEGIQVTVIGFKYLFWESALFPSTIH